MNGEAWSDRQCRLPTQKEDVPDVHPGDAEEEEEVRLKPLLTKDNYVLRGLMLLGRPVCSSCVFVFVSSLGVSFYGMR